MIFPPNEPHLITHDKGKSIFQKYKLGQAYNVLVQALLNITYIYNPIFYNKKPNIVNNALIKLNDIMFSRKVLSTNFIRKKNFCIDITMLANGICNKFLRASTFDSF